MKEPTHKKKQYLLTWYGITDLRAALGFETGNGPVLGALKSGDFSEVVILAYSVPGKVSGDKVDLKSLSHENHPPARQAEVIDRLANTPQAHQLFENWLAEKLDELSLKVRIRVCPTELSALNDARGIQGGANRALDLVASTPGPKRITFYISPGTPVMAFTWAFTALTNPELDIQILASSQPNKPPETVELPYELMAPSNRKLKVLSGEPEEEFEVIFHIMGQQRMPVLLGVREFKARKHIFVTGGDYGAGVMKKFVKAGAWSEIAVNAFDPMMVKMALLKEAAKLPEGVKVGFNLTGGTKLMFVGALAACRKIGGVPFYFETNRHRLIFLQDYTQRVPRGVEDCESFLSLHGFDILTPGKWEDVPLREKRASMTRWLWQKRSWIAKFYYRLTDYNNEDENNFLPFALEQTIKKTKVSISLDRKGHASLVSGSDQFNYANCPDFAKYLSGGWLEEFVYLQLCELLEKGLLRDLRIGVEVSSKDLGRQDNKVLPVQEFDGLMTDGQRLILIECKAGRVTDSQLYKLQQLARNYGGIESHGLLVGAFPPPKKIVRDRIDAARNIHGIYGRDVVHGLSHLVRTILAPNK